MAKTIKRIVLTGGPAAGKTSLISRILKEFKEEDGFKVITIPETATELISGFTLGPFPGCMSMLEFQYFVISDQLHKEQLALKGAETVPQDKIIIIYDRAIFDDRAYMTQEEFENTLAYFKTTPEKVMAGYDAVLHLVSCAKGAEFAYNFDNVARYESIEDARTKDDETLKAWSSHPNLYVIDNSVDFEDKINRGLQKIYEIIGEEMPAQSKRKFLIEMPDISSLKEKYGGTVIPMTQIYLKNTIPNCERRIRRQRISKPALYLYTEKRTGEDGSKWVTEKNISKKEYDKYCLERDPELKNVDKEKYRFNYEKCKFEIDVYPFSSDKAVLLVYGDADIPEDISVIKEVTGDSNYKNRHLAKVHSLE